MNAKGTRILVLGSGPAANALSQVLNAPRIGRRIGDMDWQWRKFRRLDVVTLVLVVGTSSGVSEIIRLHQEAWGGRRFQQLRSIIFCMGRANLEELSKRDIFGRIGDFGESFSSWSAHVALVNQAESLTEWLGRMENLLPCPSETWNRLQANATCLPSLTEAIKRSDSDLLEKILPAVNGIDWDALPGVSHAQANQFRGWLATVTSGVTPNWEAARQLVVSFC